MTRKRSTPSSRTEISCTSTESSRSDSYIEGTCEGWMYWKRDENCWMKVYVVVRRHSLWLTRSSSASSLSSPLIQLAVARVERTTHRVFAVTGPSGESMELFSYDETQNWAWYDALVEAANWTRESIAEQSAVEQTKTSMISRISSFRHSSVERQYRGTLVRYNQDRKGNGWKRFWRSLGIRESLRKRMEDVVDRLDARTPTSRSWA
ncbi:hypothetical protein Poli38472_004180 [Pythium oligandrum]|uniref:PH domain-containing protein n=1 Tax=Pythium oligandrum TaxID=41045 RepID=A0A8K1CN66_PYTOL|nr:hypothetical protein Poli38472_004180 [Pythium oligandrum]|eukprot:TMW66415.1 hypothetical protein Poli38472_004180 [Pythium oligandrum]